LSVEDKNITSVVQKSVKKIDIDIKDFYDKKVKYLYSDIMNFASFAQENMDSEQLNKVYYLKVACRKIVENIKDIDEVQKNLKRYINGKNLDIKNEYDLMRIEMARTLNIIYLFRNTDDDLEVLAKLKLLEEDLKQSDIVKNGRVDELIRTHKIDSKMATSIINDSAYTYEISKKLLDIATTLWIADKEIKKLGNEL
jgi:phosphate:Na+ symporter